MSLVSTPAVVLHAFRYGESSKIVRLATRELGVQSAIAKGALRPRSKFGARLALLSEGIAQIYAKPNRELHTLAEYDVVKQRTGLAGDIKRYAGASALAELVMRATPAEANPPLYDQFVDGLSALETVQPAAVDTACLSVIWQMVSALGFSPVLAECARDGRALPAGTARFSVSDGGFLCAACARGSQGATLKLEDRATLALLVEGDPNAPPPIAGRHAAAHRRLLARFVRQHLAEERDLKALTFWEELPWRDT